MLLEFADVSLAYGASRSILSNASFALEAGSFHFLTGPSGAGKTSLLKLIYGAVRPQQGRITLAGEQLTGLDRDRMAMMRRRLGIVFQDFRLVPHLTALENAALPLRLAGGSELQIRAHVAELLNWVGLGQRLNALPDELSGGEQQRVAIARAVVNKPLILLADEPTGNIDEASAQKIMHLFIELNKLGTTVLLATHQQHWIDQLQKPVLRLVHGRVVAEDDCDVAPDTQTMVA
jgi:cell division transport system ATP-binding protein